MNDNPEDTSSKGEEEEEKKEMKYYESLESD
jgi:hypothetical protein